MKLPVYQTWFLSVIFCLQSLPVWAQSVNTGLKEKQLIALKGQPYYQTEHYSHRQGEQVWLYTKKQMEKNVDEKQIMDDKTGWLTLYRKTIVKTCEVGDIFIHILRTMRHRNNRRVFTYCQWGASKASNTKDNKYRS